MPHRRNDKLKDFYLEILCIIRIVLWRTVAIGTAFLIWAYGYAYYAGLEIPSVIHGVIFILSILSGLGLAFATMLVQWTWRYARSQF